MRWTAVDVGNQTWGRLLLYALLLLLAGCSSGPKKTALPPPSPAPPVEVMPAPLKPTPPPVAMAEARTLQAYRHEMARHLYQRHAQHVHSGRLPPMLKGVGVVEVTINDRGQVARIEWVRAPRHVPEVVKAIEDLIEAAQPYPAPRFASQVSFMETWLWNRNDRFQLDSLTLGQD